jgi:hypothetical protein
MQVQQTKNEPQQFFRSLMGSKSSTFISMVFLSWRLLKSENITLSAPAVISLVTPGGQSTCLEQAHTALTQPGSHWRGGHKVSLLHTGHKARELGGSEATFYRQGTQHGVQSRDVGSRKVTSGSYTDESTHFQEFVLYILRYSHSAMQAGLKLGSLLKAICCLSLSNARFAGMSHSTWQHLKVWMFAC